jgi:hypothetical protein
VFRYKQTEYAIVHQLKTEYGPWKCKHEFLILNKSTTPCKPIPEPLIDDDFKAQMQFTLFKMMMCSMLGNKTK